MNAQTLEKQDINFGITGYFDAQTVSALEEDFQTLVKESKGRLIIDLSAVDFMDSSGIGSIVFLYKRLKAQNRELVLSGVNGQPARLIQSLRVDKTITTEFSEQEQA
ncbi:MAG: anti-anti-sigma factor [Zetaproteobacteria bacterium]|nr:MAG: anti-anti-sigma factor [Zetaproteobacteria bacterium]